MYEISSFSHISKCRSFFFSPQSQSNMHYPAKYDRDSHLGDVLPEHFQDGKEKPPADNNDFRYSMANLLRYMDDVFDSVMQSIKKAGQWDNTIVLFMSDNGGAVYTFTGSNNYPLRGSKLSKWEGATRVNAFLSGGWVDKAKKTSRETRSDSYVFAMDWAPTLLQMAGGDKSMITGDKIGTTYGNGMWDFIKNSVNMPAKPNSPHQLERKVSYSSDLMYHVKEDTTFKFFNTGNIPQVFTRKWNPVWPTNDDLIPDFG